MTGGLPQEYTFERDLLLEPIRKASKLRNMGIPITASAESFHDRTEIITIVDDPQIGISPEPIAGVRSTNSITSVPVKMASISAPVSYSTQELQRMNNGKLPFDRRMSILAHYIGDREDAYAFAGVSTDLNDSDGKPFLENGTAVTSNSLASEADAMAGLSVNIAALITRYGELKSRPLVFAMNAVAYAVAIGLKNANTDSTFLENADKMLKFHGGAGSGIIVIPHLGCTLTQTDDVVTITDNVNETVALMLMDINHFEIVTSKLAEQGDFNEYDGLRMAIFEKFLPYVHDALSIRWEANVAIA